MAASLLVAAGLAVALSEWIVELASTASTNLLYSAFSLSLLCVFLNCDVALSTRDALRSELYIYVGTIHQGHVRARIF